MPTREKWWGYCVETEIGIILFINIATTKMIILNGNTAIQYGGAVFIDHSNLYLCGSIHLNNNTANYGGAMGFIKGYLIISNGTNITLSQNYAEKLYKC